MINICSSKLFNVEKTNDGEHANTRYPVTQNMNTEMSSVKSEESDKVTTERAEWWVS